MAEENEQAPEKPEYFERRKHLVNPAESTEVWHAGFTNQDVIDLARISQTPITTLCGFEWLPSWEGAHIMCDDCMRAGLEIVTAAEG